MSAVFERRKPLGGKSYGHIPHFPGSRMGPGDHKCSDGQLRIATEKARDRHDHIIVQEKVDGSNVGVVKLEGVIIPLTRAGYVADTSPYEQHWRFGEWVYENQNRFTELLSEGERVCGEWLMQAHGTRYNLPHEPFVVFDLMQGQKRLIYEDVHDRVMPLGFIMPSVIHEGDPLSIEDAIEGIKRSGHGAIDPVEGAVWRVERNELVNKAKGGERRWIVDYLAKYVRPEKVDGRYLPENNNGETIWNWQPDRIRW